MANDPNDRRDQNEGGLFSDDYEAPKRENPYLKKNREKAAREAAERAAKEEAERARKAAREEAVRARKAEEAARREAALSSRDYADSPDKPASPSSTEPDKGGYKRRRTFSDFLFEHVKLITVIVTSCLILSLVLITDVVSIVENLITESQQADKEYINIKYVEGLSKMSEPITWGHLSKFRRTTSATKNSLKWMLDVEGGKYQIWVLGSDASHTPTSVLLISMDSGEQIDLNKDDFNKFISENP